MKKNDDVLLENNGIEDSILHIIKNYAQTWDVLLRYDENRLEVAEQSQFDAVPVISYDEVREAIQSLSDELEKQNVSTVYFGREYNDMLKGILGNLNQSFGGTPVYPLAEQRAAHLLYFVIKDHPFRDGNKRIGCLLFLIYLKKAGLNLETISNKGLTTLALFIAESDPSQKDTTTQLIANLIAMDR